MNSTLKLLQAARFAAEKHAGQFRKGTRRDPYINHPLTVAQIIANIGEIEDEDIICAAILHDTIEDCDVSRDEIADLFGDAVADYVNEVSDDKSLPKMRRKELQIEHAPHLSAGAKMIKIADKICNVSDVARDPGVDWDLTRRLEYIAWAEAVVAGLRGVNTGLEAEFDLVLTQAKAEIN